MNSEAQHLRVTPGTDFDDATVVYAAAAHQCFQQLQDAASRLASILLVMSFERSRHALDHATREAAASQIMQGRECFMALKPTHRVGHFHRHLCRGLERLISSSHAIDQTLANKAQALDPLPLLVDGWRELECASKCLPGFEVVDFSHSCCAQHSADLGRG
ncbi:hypothetical protein I8746_06265 [Pseudomonas sp. USTB-Z]|uniref:hypothetical protein n=1 Tax=Pseudomonas TaxID=286 RepID=UPI0018ABB4BC|nr:MULTISPECIES: hypothetical protein [Pseudomonas]MBF8789643.1 hypothetical protein [Pseudomonas asiatica]MBX6689198.1 hypothetical protein [Pseudomonas sp. USTB-Z]